MDFYLEFFFIFILILILNQQLFTGVNKSCFPMEPWQDEIKIAIPNLEPFHEEPKLELTLDSPPPYSGLDNSILPVPPSYSDLLHTTIDRDQLYTARETNDI